MTEDCKDLRDLVEARVTLVLLVLLVPSVPQVLLVFLAHKDRRDPKDQLVQLARRETLAWWDHQVLLAQLVTSFSPSPSRQVKNPGGHLTCRMTKQQE